MMIVVTVCATVAVTLAACSSSAKPGSTAPVTTATQPDLAKEMLDWYRSGPSDDLDALISDQTAIGNAGNDLGTVLAACKSLKRDVVSFESDASAPDRVLRTDLARALDSYSTGASECLNGDLTSAASDISDGTTWIARTTERIRVIGGSN
jgi:hypothetical protein